MSKKFLNLNQQIDKIKAKGIKCDIALPDVVLFKNGYFNLVNGYKTCFIATVLKKKKKYIHKAALSKFVLVKEFDDNLRKILFNHISRIEEELRVITAYKFDELYDGKTKWKKVSAYGIFDKNQIKSLIDDLNKQVNDSKNDYVIHFINKHKFVPTWICLKVIKFSTFISFIAYSKDEVKNYLCTLYNVLDNSGNPNPKLLVSSLQWIRKYRNVCAHNERVLCLVRKNGRIKEKYLKSLNKKSYIRDHDQKMIDLLLYLKYYLAPSDYIELIKNIKNLLLELKDNLKDEYVFDKVRSNLGIKNLNDLDILVTKPNHKKYTIIKKVAK